jgi:hypothetical protein
MAGMCWHVGFLRSARATLEVVFRYLRHQINRRITFILPLLGTPLSTGQARIECLTARCNDLGRVGERLKLISAHDALVLLKNSLRAPKLQHTFQTDCCKSHNLLTTCDRMLRSALNSICNVKAIASGKFSYSRWWIAGQTHVIACTSAFSTSVAGKRDLPDLILRRTEKTTDDVFDRSLVSQLSKFPMPSSSESAAGEQQAWGNAVIEAEFRILILVMENFRKFSHAESFRKLSGKFPKWKL